MSIYEVTVTREVVQETATVVVRAKSEGAARRKALRLVSDKPDQWFPPLDAGALTASDIEQLDFEPDCEVL